MKDELDRRRLRIIVADDNRDAAVALAMLLDRLGFDVVATVFDGDAAWQSICNERPHVAILDIALPGMDGLEVAQLTRQDSGATRLVAVTGLGGACDRVDAMQAGFDAHFTKPVSGHQLEELMVSYLRSSASGV
jgi:CheY-like chemotaxis protein